MPVLIEMPRQKKVNRLGRYFPKKRTSSPPKELKFPNLVASRQNEEMSRELSHQTASMTRPSTPRPHKRTSKLSPMKRKLPRLRELTSTPGDLKNEIRFVSSSNITQKALPKIPSGKKNGGLLRFSSRSTKRRRR